MTAERKADTCMCGHPASDHAVFIDGEYVYRGECQRVDCGDDVTASCELYVLGTAERKAEQRCRQCEWEWEEGEMIDTRHHECADVPTESEPERDSHGQDNSHGHDPTHYATDSTAMDHMPQWTWPDGTPREFDGPQCQQQGYCSCSLADCSTTDEWSAPETPSPEVGIWEHDARMAAEYRASFLAHADEMAEHYGIASDDMAKLRIYAHSWAGAEFRCGAAAKETK